MRLPFLVAAWFCVAYGVLLSSPVHATLNVTVLDTTLDIGDEGTIDIEISGTGDLVAAMSLELRITPIGGVSSSLVFVDPQTISFRSDPSYLFFGDSDNEMNAFDPRAVSQTTLQQDTFLTSTAPPAVPM